AVRSMTDFTDLIDLAAERLGGKVLSANDEFFAPKENILRAAAPVWKEGEYTDAGKWMDGWETRRRRTPGHDWCTIRLGIPGVVRGVVVDTSFFTGNYPERCSLEACSLPPNSSAEEVEAHEGWTELLPPSALAGGAQNRFAISSSERHSHLRFNIFPDGGVARLRVFGECVPDRDRLASAGEVDLAALENGGFVLLCSDMFFGHRQNLILPGRSLNMGDGWETKRRRGSGNDWTIVRLAVPGIITRAEIDTDHYKGNAPGSFSLEGCNAPGSTGDDLTACHRAWAELVPRDNLRPDARHVFDRVKPVGIVSHVRLNIFPDGGVARLRLYGKPA
ncbi:MAG: allantoicase, partial [Gemmatimonadaceae bacterium]